MERSLLTTLASHRLWLFVSVAISALALLGVYRTLRSDVAGLRHTVSVLEQDLAWLAGANAEVRALRTRLGTGAAIAPAKNVLLVIEQTAVEAGLRQSITVLAPQEDGRIGVDLAGAPLVEVVRWLEQLEWMHAIRVTTAQFQRAGPGRTDVRLQFEHAHGADTP